MSLIHISLIHTTSNIFITYMYHLSIYNLSIYHLYISHISITYIDHFYRSFSMRFLTHMRSHAFELGIVRHSRILEPFWTSQRGVDILAKSCRPRGSIRASIHRFSFFKMMQFLQNASVVLKSDQHLSTSTRIAKSKPPECERGAQIQPKLVDVCDESPECVRGALLQPKPVLLGGM